MKVFALLSLSILLAGCSLVAAQHDHGYPISSDECRDVVRKELQERVDNAGGSVELTSDFRCGPGWMGDLTYPGLAVGYIFMGTANLGIPNLESVPFCGVMQKGPLGVNVSSNHFWYSTRANAGACGFSSAHYSWDSRPRHRVD